MTQERASDLVEDLIQAFHDYETFGKKSYRQDYEEMKRKVIDALTTSEVAPAQCNSPGEA